MDAEKVADDIRSLLDGDSIAIVGGTVWEEEGHTDPLRDTDEKALDAENFDIDDTFKAVYEISGEELVDAIGDQNVYVTGGTVANPYSRILAGADPERVNEVTLGELGGERRFPLTFDTETISSRDFNQDEGLKKRAERLRDNNDNYEHLSGFEQALVAYNTPAADFRVNEDLRPNYVVDRSYGDDGADVSNEFESIWITQDGEITELETEKQKDDYLSRRFAPVANGDGWKTDYSILGVHENPHGDGKIVAAQGAHGFGTQGVNEMITFPDGDILDTDSALEALGQFQDETEADEYQALIQTYRNPKTKETRNNLVAVGEL